MRAILRYVFALRAGAFVFESLSSSLSLSLTSLFNDSISAAVVSRLSVNIVESATVDLNGVRVVDRTDFNRKTSRVCLPVRLQAGENTLAVNVVGDPDSEIAILIGPAPIAPRK